MFPILRQGITRGLLEEEIQLTKIERVDDYRKYLDPKVRARISGLDLKARLIVEGFVSGLHRSPYHGFSVEFAEHREYVPGDDLRHVDWKVFGKSDRYYLKQFEEETNFACTYRPALIAWFFATRTYVCRVSSQPCRA